MRRKIESDPLENARHNDAMRSRSKARLDALRHRTDADREVAAAKFKARHKKEAA